MFLIKLKNIIKKVKSVYERVAHQAGDYPGFFSMKQLGVFVLPLDKMLVHCRPLPAIYKVSWTIHRYLFIHLGGERHCES